MKKTLLSTIAAANGSLNKRNGSLPNGIYAEYCP